MQRWDNSCEKHHVFFIRIAINFNDYIFLKIINLWGLEIWQNLHKRYSQMHFFWFYDNSGKIQIFVQYIERNNHERSLNIDKRMMFERFLIKQIITWRFLHKILSHTLKKWSVSSYSDIDHNTKMKLNLIFIKWSRRFKR